MKKLFTFTILMLLVLCAPAFSQIAPYCQQWPIAQQAWTGHSSSVYQFVPQFVPSPSAAIKGTCNPIPIAQPPFVVFPPYGNTSIGLSLRTNCTFGIIADIAASTINNGLGSTNYQQDVGDALRVTDNAILHYTFSEADCGCYPNGIFVVDWDFGC